MKITYKNGCYSLYVKGARFAYAGKFSDFLHCIKFGTVLWMQGKYKLVNGYWTIEKE